MYLCMFVKKLPIPFKGKKGNIQKKKLNSGYTAISIHKNNQKIEDLILIFISIYSEMVDFSPFFGGLDQGLFKLV